MSKIEYCLVFVAALCSLLLQAAPSVYDDMDGMSGQVTEFWDTSKRTGIAVDSADSAVSATLDTFTWHSCDSTLPVKLNTKPFVSLKLILR